MSYYRLYPEKNNTIFRYGKYISSTLTSYSSENVNCGANPVMEMMDGKGESKLLFGFQILNTLQTKLKNNNFTCKLQLWDAGTLYEPATKLKNVVLEQFDGDFSEGDGYSFSSDESKIGVSNWINANSMLLWSDVTFNTVASYQMNRINEDFSFDVTASLTPIITSNTFNSNNLYNLSLKINDGENDAVNIYRKFIHSNYTKTVFKPYLEFFIDDTISDASNNCVANQVNRIYIVNKAGKPFTSTPVAKITMDNLQTIVTATQINNGCVYYIEVTPTSYSTISKLVTLNILWSIDGESVQKQVVEVSSPNVLTDSFDSKNLFFYPVTPLSHNVVKQGDILPFSIISEIRGKGLILQTTFEYKICSMDGFEMCPWMPVSLYRDKMFFNVNTEYYFPEQQYEVFVRNRTGSFTLTSTLTQKFKVQMNDKSHLRELSASPYYSRNQFFSK